ncbi:MAG: ubiquitin-like domain-containing protein [Chloroflexi bacterium]|nr:ubiquitin-like domain-containing protein [Chloroflexota bacterium]MCL5275886.1 ubiquitin-like domain-containing protein [Chloroflexota bacterium]
MFTGKNPFARRPADGNPASQPQQASRLRWLAFPIILGVLSLLTAGYLSTFTPAKILDGNRVISLQTHQTTVGAALREANVHLLPEDIISPPLSTPLNRNDTIIIKRARLVRVNVDGQEPVLVRTQGNTAEDVLAKLGYNIGDRDKLTVNNQPSTILPAAAGLAPDVLAANIRFKHAIAVTIQQQDAPPKTILTTAPTVGEALLEAGYKLFLADTVQPSPSAPLQAGEQIQLSRSKPVSVWVDGRRVRTRTNRPTVGDVLADLNIVLYGEDYAKPGLDAKIVDNLEVRVVRVRHEIAIDQEVIPFETRTEPDSNVELDQVVLGQKGAPGVHERRTLITYEDDNETHREVIADFVALDPQPRIYNYGTKVVLRTLDTPSGPVQYWRVIHMLATSYSASTAGVSLGASWYGHVRCGFAMRSGIVAVDPHLIPLRTNVYVPGYGPGYACDTGSAIIGKRIDLGYDDNNLQSWYRWVDVYLLTPVPANINYSIN